MSIFRGSWIALTNNPKCQRFRCPSCGNIVSMLMGSPTYPTCPWCLYDLPEAEDFDTPSELEQRKRGNRAATGKVYSESREDNEAWNAKRREYYARNGEHLREYKRKYYEDNKERLRAYRHKYYQEHKEKFQEYSKKYYQSHREEILARIKKKCKENPEKCKEYQKRYRGKSMREVEAHIRGVSVDELPRSGFYFGKGVKR